MLSDGLQSTVTIAAMAVTTYALRLAGLFIGHKLPTRGPFAVALARMPGLIMVSMVAPAVVRDGWIGLLGVGVAGACWRLSNGNLLAAILGGIVTVAIGRAL